jgi:2,3-bisphosphoglycerate-independent phosphoglycerate mutase
MVAHDLLLRGLEFEDAYAIARSVRDLIGERREIESTEVADLVQREVERSMPPADVASMSSPRPPSLPSVAYEDRAAQPFSRGVLARTLRAAGLAADNAYKIATDVQSDLLAEGLEQLTNDELAKRVGASLEEGAGREPARRYRTMRRIGQLPRPLVVYLAGPTGSGKSTLALELAPLLGVYQINATDTIRQVMRMVFSPTILPGLHRSSFEGVSRSLADVLEDRLEDPSHAVLRAFEEQATRVCVGVRAVVERALDENVNVVLEGVHLLPPLVPFADLDGAAHQVMLMLSTLDEEAHRARFLSRGTMSGRQAADYLENFSAIREIQEFLLESAEAYDVPVLDTQELDPSVSRALRLIASSLAEQAPWIAEAEGAADLVTALFLFVDGLADWPVRALGDRTPLQAAHTPNLDRLALEGACGLADPVQPDTVPDTSSGTLALFGHLPEALARGPVEAIGAGLEVGPGDIALRGNFATLDESGRIVDRRAGRIRDDAAELARSLDGMTIELDGDPVVVAVKAATEHRIAIVLRGASLSSAIVGSDPGDGAYQVPPLAPRARDAKDAAAVRTAGILGAFEARAREILAEQEANRRRRENGLAEANAVLTRGAGRIHRLLPLSAAGRRLDIACVGGDGTVLGVAGALGAELITDEAMTANLDTDLALKLERAVEQLAHRDLVVVHFKGADIAAHDRRPDLKVEYLERLDRELGAFLEHCPPGVRILVAADHATLSEIGRHGADPVPVLLWGPGVEPDSVDRFDETTVGAGRLQRFPLRQLLERTFGPRP